MLLDWDEDDDRDLQEAVLLAALQRWVKGEASASVHAHIGVA